MPGANTPLEIVRLASDEGVFAILGRFTAGFERTVCGGYPVAEEFVVLRGSLELENVRVGPGTVCHVPAGHPRAPMSSSEGCTVIAWFAGVPEFRQAQHLRTEPGSAMATAAVASGPPGTRLLRTADTDWVLADQALLQVQAQPVDVVDMRLSRWTRLGAETPAHRLAVPVLARLPRR